jgi:5'-3' exoribonuclease 2
VIEEPTKLIDGVEYPADYSNPNPNGELDNLYLDMNGIVHPCTHPEGRPAPETEDEMMVEVFRYTDRVLSMARPRKVLMIAVDGVAPRAKMNQQRSRRFRAAQDARIENEAREVALAQAEAQGQVIDEALKGKRRWDSNVITPGTPFMKVLAKSLRYWTVYKLNNDPGWKDLKVIISDATVPGEGEHKIMEFIRSQRADPTYDPNTSHCIYGLDADLIFLGLATHEPHFRILREDVYAKDKNSRGGNRNNNNFGFTSEDQARLQVEESARSKELTPFIWLHVDILRQYLEAELTIKQLPFAWNLERAIDDWVFLCFFVGNDFLPHLPSMDVRDHSIEKLRQIWMDSLGQMGGYLTCDGEANLKRLEVVLRKLALDEKRSLERKYRDDMQRAANKRQRIEDRDRLAVRSMEDRAVALDAEQRAAAGAVPAVSKNRGEKAPIQPLENMPLYTPSGESVGNTHMSNSDIVKNRNAINMANMANKSAAEQLRSLLLNGGATPSDSSAADSPASSSDDKFNIDAVHASDEEENPKKRKAEEPALRDTEEPEGIDLGRAGYNERYYRAKFNIPSSEVHAKRRDLVFKYIEGVCWVLKYYYQGCASWNWYYPYHYAPFAADFVDIGDFEIKFERGEPFRPYEQLMSVLPVASNHTLPKVFRPLMSDPDSDIVDFYPEDFLIDMNGKKNAWQGIPLLPFIDEKRLLTAVQGKYDELTADETLRNTNQKEYLYIGPHNVMYKDLVDTFYGDVEESNPASLSVVAKKTLGLAGTVIKDVNCVPGAPFAYPLNTGGFPDIEQNGVLSVRFDYPVLPVPNKSMLRPGVHLTPSVLTRFEEQKLASRDAYRPGYRGRNGADTKVLERKAESSHKAPGYPGSYENFVGAGAAANSAYERERGPDEYDNNRGYGGDRNNNYNGGSRGGYNQRGGSGNYRGRGGYRDGGYNNGGGYNNNNGGYNNNGRYNNGGRGGYNNNNYRGGYNNNNSYRGGYNNNNNYHNNDNGRYNEFQNTNRRY